MKISTPVTFALGAVTALVIGSGTAYAATGGTFLLGKSNSATTPTSLTNSKGTALVLNSKAGTPPLKVNNGTKATNLNADKLDNLDSTSLALANGQTNTLSALGEVIDFDEDGVGDAIAAFAVCPAGTKMTGGGGDDYTQDGTMVINSPLDRNIWMVASTTATITVENAENIVAYAVCYNPRGAVAGGDFRVRPRAADVDLAKERLARKLG